MNATLKKGLASLAAFFRKKINRRLTCLALLGLFALGDFALSGLVRRTFVFFSNIEGNAAVEERMLRRSFDRETAIRRYVEEALLGPVSPDSAPLFPRETRLNSFMYRDGAVYADLSEPAALALPGGVGVFRSLLALNEGLRRNFACIRDARIFIGGNEVFFEEFRGIFADPADNTKTAP